MNISLEQLCKLTYIYKYEVCKISYYETLRLAYREKMGHISFFPGWLSRLTEAIGENLHTTL